MAATSLWCMHVCVVWIMRKISALHLPSWPPSLSSLPACIAVAPPGLQGRQSASQPPEFFGSPPQWAGVSRISGTCPKCLLTPAAAVWVKSEWVGYWTQRFNKQMVTSYIWKLRKMKKYHIHISGSGIFGGLLFEKRHVAGAPEQSIPFIKKNFFFNGQLALIQYNRCRYCMYFYEVCIFFFINFEHIIT